MLQAMHEARDTFIPRFGSALSVRPQAASAIKEAAERAVARLGDAKPDLGYLFFTATHTDHAKEMVSLVLKLTGVQTLITMSGHGVIGGGIEVEGSPGVSLMLASMPGATINPFRIHDLPSVPKQPAQDWHREIFAPAMHIGSDHVASMMFCDPFTVPLVRVLPAMSIAGRSMPVVGGFASSGKAPGENVIGLNDHIMTTGGIGISIAGQIGIDGVVSQGCKPIGPTMIVTKARDNIILELSGRNALETIRAGLQDVPQNQRAALSQGILLGRVINEYKDRFGQGDFLIRQVKSIEKSNGALVSDDFFRVGQTVQLHVRDANTARSDLAMVLDAQKLRPSPAAGLVFNCISRGKKLFGSPNQDAAAISRAFNSSQAGVEQAKSGEHIDVSQSSLPLAGVFSKGEIGPVGSKSYLHTMTTSLALFRSDRPVL